MPGNTIGKLFRLTTFGESHGLAIGGIIDGFPAGLAINSDFTQNELDKRKPGSTNFGSPRKESDHLEILSGVFQGVSLGTPIAFMVRNADAKPGDYEALRNTFRPSHADYTYSIKYGIRDHRGGGRSSARETVSRVVAGAFAKLFLAGMKISINAFTDSIGPIKITNPDKYQNIASSSANQLRCPDPAISEQILLYLADLKEQGDSTGGTIFCRITGLPPGLGEPVFEKTESELAKAMLSINACIGFEYGSGFAGAALRGSENNDQWKLTEAKKHNGITLLETVTNNSGGIQGGITNGQDIYFRVAFKPVASIRQPQMSYTSEGEHILLEGGGRHDICVVPRAVAVVEAMAAIVIADLLLQQNAYKS